MSKHTPGPWHLKLGQYGAPHEIAWEPGKSYGQIAKVMTRSFAELPEAKSEAEIEANARLIAAAPDLLEAAERFIASIDSHPQDYELDTKAHGLAVCLNTRSGELLREAVAKARRA